MVSALSNYLPKIFFFFFFDTFPINFFKFVSFVEENLKKEENLADVLKTLILEIFLEFLETFFEEKKKNLFGLFFFNYLFMKIILKFGKR